MKEMIYQKTRSIDVLDDGYYKDYHYVVLSMGTHPCGYVEIKLGHKLYGMLINDIWEYNPEVHGGITYSREYVSLDNLNDTYTGWWIGWDYAHYGDYMGYYNDNPDKYVCLGNKQWTTAEMVSECKNVIDQLIEYEKE